MQTIFLVRHGETQWNAEDRLQGEIQHIRMNEEGVRQSQLLSKRLAGEKIDMIFSSPAERALQTAEIIAEPHDLSIITHEGIRERTHGIVDGMFLSEFRKKYPEVSKVYDETKELPGIKGAESLNQVSDRVVPAFEEIVKKNGGKTILIVSHGGVLKNLISHLTGKPRNSFSQHNCCLNIIKFDGKNFKVEKIDDTSHLEMETD